jgi:beta-glucosidase
MSVKEPYTEGMSEPYRDTSLPFEKRAADLVSRMTLEEKLTQLLHDSPAVERLGIPAYGWWNECLHGVARNGKSTVFPQSIGLAAAFDEELVYGIAQAVSDEARAKYHVIVRDRGSTGKYEGLTFWSPNVNIFRDPRWGRGQETYGEDPFLTSRLGTAFVRGLQGDDPRYLKAAACAKHYAVHSGPEKDRHRFDAEVSVKDLHETYLPAFKALVEADVEAVMGAYNRVNGEPCCAHRLLLEEILRGEWGFTGHVVSDCWAILDFHTGHGVTSGPEESAALALSRGCDLNCGCTYELLTLRNAIERGLVTEDTIDRSLVRLFTTRFKLGMFDPDEKVPYASIDPAVIRRPEHTALARKAAEESIVLLKNNGILPLNPNRGRYYVTGPFAADASVLLGTYAGIPERFVTPLEGIVAAAGPGVRVEYKKGCMPSHPNRNPLQWAVGGVKGMDAVIAVMGYSADMEGEEGDAIDSPELGDREDIMLPPHQAEFLKRLCATGVPVILVLCGGSPIALGGLENEVAAIIMAWYSGEQGGTAIGEVIFGAVNPSGKLPVTFPVSVDQLPPYGEYAMDGRTYRFLHGAPLFPFGFGLSYAAFTYHGLTLETDTVAPGESLTCEVTLENTGSVAGEEVVQLYLTDLEASVRVPAASLCGFRRVRLEPGESKTVRFMIAPEMMELVTETGERKIEPGRFRVTAGGSSPCARSRELGAPAPVTAEFTVR